VALIGKCYYLGAALCCTVKGLLLAGGHGTRLRPLTFTGNKHMIPIANKPMLFHGLEHMVNAGIKEIGVILGPIKEGVRESLGNGSIFGAEITYIEQPDPKGLAHAVLISEDFVSGDPFVMYLGDNLIKQGVKPLIYSYYNEASDCVICVSKVKNPEQYGVVEINSEGQILRLVEKPQKAISNLALAGVYLFNDKVFEAAKAIKPSWRNELEITDAIQYLLDTGRKIAVQNIDGWWKDTGKPEDILEANQLVLDDIQTYFENAIIDHLSHVTGKVYIGKNTIIHPNTTIKGPSTIGEDCEIGPNVYIGPYTSIGDKVKVLSGEVESSIIMSNVIINCSRRIVDSIIGKYSRLESGATILPAGIRLVLGENTVCRL
jgi:glucose-1-phosphate thymidylyltransferase